jgi:hypothetical protein
VEHALKRIVLICSIALGPLAACGAQASPQRPSGSAASLAEPEAGRVAVVRALREDPPLPGTAASGWEGLQSPAGGSAADPHAHHHNQHGKAGP